MTTLVFALGSGCPGADVAGFATEIKGYTAGATGDSQCLGFFAAGGPGNSVAVASYQDSTYRTDGAGADHGRGINCKYIDANTVLIDGAANHTLPSVAASGSLLIAVSGIGSSVQTQNARVYSFQMSAASGVQDLTAADNMTIQMAEIDVDTAWTDVSSDGSNFLTLNNHSVAADRHDFYVAISVRPDSTGTKSAWGIFGTFEYF